jgi:hypothetical protein
VTLRPQVEDWTPARPSRLGRLVVVGIAAVSLLLAIATRHELAGVDQEVHRGDRDLVTYQRDVAGAMLEVAGGHQQQAEQLGELARRLGLVCDTLQVLVGAWPGRAEVPRTIGDACKLPEAGAMLYGARR